MRHHLAADLAEARQAIGDANEALTLVHNGDVAGLIPAVHESLGGLLRLSQIHRASPIRPRTNSKAFLIVLTANRACVSGSTTLVDTPGTGMPHRPDLPYRSARPCLRPNQAY